MSARGESNRNATIMPILDKIDEALNRLANNQKFAQNGTDFSENQTELYQKEDYENQPKRNVQTNGSASTRTTPNTKNRNSNNFAYLLRNSLAFAPQLSSALSAIQLAASIATIKLPKWETPFDTNREKKAAKNAGAGEKFKTKSELENYAQANIATANNETLLNEKKTESGPAKNAKTTESNAENYKNTKPEININIPNIAALNEKNNNIEEAHNTKNTTPTININIPNIAEANKKNTLEQATKTIPNIAENNAKTTESDATNHQKKQPEININIPNIAAINEKNNNIDDALNAKNNNIDTTNGKTTPPTIIINIPNIAETNQKNTNSNQTTENSNDEHRSTNLMRLAAEYKLLKNVMAGMRLATNTAVKGMQIAASVMATATIATGAMGAALYAMAENMSGNMLLMPIRGELYAFAREVKVAFQLVIGGIADFLQTSGMIDGFKNIMNAVNIRIAQWAEFFAELGTAFSGYNIEIENCFTALIDIAAYLTITFAQTAYVLGAFIKLLAKIIGTISNLFVKFFTGGRVVTGDENENVKARRLQALQASMTHQGLVGTKATFNYMEAASPERQTQRQQLERITEIRNACLKILSGAGKPIVLK